jgi:hypothetical protein
MSTTDIMRAAFDRLESFTFVPPPKILWPGIQSDPPASGIWLEPKLFPNEPSDIAWDDDGCLDTRGFFRILVYFRPGMGQVEPSEMADLLIELFPKGLELGPVRVSKRPWQSPLVTEDASKLFIPVTVPYMGLT